MYCLDGGGGAGEEDGAGGAAEEEEFESLSRRGGIERQGPGSCADGDIHTHPLLSYSSLPEITSR
jgi:hypothetical protein